MWKDPEPNDIENWVCVFECGTEYEAEMAKNYLANLEIPANILSKRDSSYNLNVGDMALVYVYVPRDYGEQAYEAINEWRDPEEGEVVFLAADKEQVELAEKVLDRNSIPADLRELAVDSEEAGKQTLFALYVSQDDEDEARNLIAEWDANRNQ